MDTAELEAEVLGWLLDDYENPKTLTQDMSRELGLPVTEAEVAAALSKLQERGLVDRFLFNEATGEFELAPTATDAQERDRWFLASAEGRRILSGP